MSMEEKKKVTRATREATVGPLDRPPPEALSPTQSPSTNKPLPAIQESLSTQHLPVENQESIETSTRKALTDPRVFEPIPAAFSLSFVLGKHPPSAEDLEIANLLQEGQYYLVIQRTQSLLTSSSTDTLPLQEIWSLWILRIECFRLLFAPRPTAIELNRLKLPAEARIPWDFQVLRTLIMGMASSRWTVVVNEWLAMAGDTRRAMKEQLDAAEEDKKEQIRGLWTGRLQKLEELVCYGLIEGKEYDLAVRHLRRLIEKYARDEEETEKYTSSLFHVYLQMGRLDLAEPILDKLPSEKRGSSSALLDLAKEDYASALQKYTSLIREQQGNLLYTTNLALTHLYTANVQSAIATLEPKLQQPGAKRGILPHAVFNLNTMYEIRDDKARSRKEAIMESVVGNYGDVCGKGHFKLDSLR